MTSEPERRAPTASYRLQLQPSFTLDDAAAAVPYLAALGVSHLHLSPLLEAVRGSTHGYDTVDHTRVSEQLGGERALRGLAEAAHACGLGLIADTVPNHMAVPVPERLNRPLWQVLRDGPDSPYARWFDIDWAARGRVLLPVLGNRLGDELDRLAVEKLSDAETSEEGVLRYHDHVFPLRPGTEDLPLSELLDHQWYRLAWWRLARTELDYRRFFTVSGLIGVRVEDPEVFAVTHAVLLRLYREGVLDGFRIDHPDGLADPVGYLRRLAAETHGAYVVVEKILTGSEQLPPDWPCAGTTGYDALRHIDAVLTDAAGAAHLTDAYLAFTGDREAQRGPSSGGTSWPRSASALAEAAERTVRSGSGSGVPGTVDTARRGTPGAVGSSTSRPIAAPGGCADHGVAGPVRASFADAAHAGRGEMTGAEGELAAEVERLVRVVERVCQEVPTLRDHAPWAVRRALAATLAAYPVYRPYVRPGEAAPPEDVARVREAAGAARRELAADPVAAPHAGAADLVGDLALGVLGRGPARDEFCIRFAQTASAVAAKGVEDTAFYRWNALLSANEVGGDPGRPAVTPAEFHAYCARMQRDRPQAMTALSTHDTKRSADARARLAALAEQADTWAQTAATWSAMADRTPLRDPDTEWLVWQTVVAAWPAEAERLVATVLKSVREAKRRTSWTEPDPDFERAVADYLRAALAYEPLVERIDAFVLHLAPAARVHTLSGTLLHLTMPGVPDVYQGSEEPLRTLVDPDNRLPVDLGALAARLAALDDGAHPADSADLAAEKLHLTATALRLRRDRPDAFAAAYTPLAARGPAADHALACLRGGEVLAVATRLPYGLRRSGGWEGTTLPLPPGRWADLLTGRQNIAGDVPLAALLTRLPVALLVAP